MVSLSLEAQKQRLQYCPGFQAHSLCREGRPALLTTAGLYPLLTRKVRIQLHAHSLGCCQAPLLCQICGKPQFLTTWISLQVPRCLPSMLAECSRLNYQKEILFGHIDRSCSLFFFVRYCQKYKHIASKTLCSLDVNCLKKGEILSKCRYILDIIIKLL